MTEESRKPGKAAPSPSLAIATLDVAGGSRIGICRLPGLLGQLELDLACVRQWKPAIVLSLTERGEMAAYGCTDLEQRLARDAIAWSHLPIRDFGGLGGSNAEAWPALSSHLHEVLDRGEGVLVHCRGGQGRSGMVALRLLVERGEDAAIALSRLRALRPGAVETDEQLAWACNVVRR